MKPYVFRLTKGNDLRIGIEEYLKDHEILNGSILSGVGCLSKVKIRLAKAKTFYEKTDDYEIVSLCGTSSLDGVHLHLSCSDSSGKTIGGHLCYGSIVNTTAEIVYLSLDEYELQRKFDQTTGYDELVVKEK